MRGLALALGLMTASAWGQCVLVPSSGDAAVDKILGPQCTDGTLPSTFMNSVAQVSADLAIQNQSLGVAGNGRFYPYFLPTYFSTGQVQLNTGSATITGIGGTTLKTDLCGGAATPPYPTFSWLSLQYTGTDGLTHYTVSPAVTACASESSITVAAILSPSGASKFPACSPCTLHYVSAHDGLNGLWPLNGAPANYYDNALALYRHYYRTGNATYKAAADLLADEWWEGPELDRGTCGQTFLSYGGYCVSGRSLSYGGIMLRAHLSNNSTTWAALRAWRDYIAANLTPSFNGYGRMFDEREQSYYLMYQAMGAILDPDATERGNWRTQVVNILDNQFQAYRGDASRLWQVFGPDPANGGKASFNQGSHVVLNGTSTVTLVGDTWSSGDFTPVGAGRIIFFATPGSIPAWNASYEFHTATFASSTTATLDSPSAINNANYGYAMSLPSNTTGFIGYANQPYMMGIMATAFEFSGAALQGFNGAEATKAYGYSNDLMTWFLTYPLRPDITAFWYQIQSPGCMGTPNPLNLFCAGNDNGTINSFSAARTLTVETVDAFARNYARTGNAAIPTFLNPVMAANWTVAGDCNENTAQYINDYNIACIPPASPEAGFWVYPPYGGTVAGAPKWYGQGFGTGNATSWYASLISVGGFKISNHGGVSLHGGIN